MCNSRLIVRPPQPDTDGCADRQCVVTICGNVCMCDISPLILASADDTQVLFLS
jgi:hypothetical protein